MKKNVRKILKEEKGAVTLLVFVTVLSFVSILLAAYLAVTTLQKSQIRSDIKIQEIYGRDVNRVDEIYQELTSKDRQIPFCDIEYKINIDEESILYELTFSEEIKNFTIDDVKIYNATKVDTGFADTLTLSTSSPAYATNLAQNKTYVVSFDYQCVSGSQDFEIGLYSETESNLPIKNLTATEELKHEEYKLQVTSSEVLFKILAQIEESNNITLSNLQIVEMQEIEAEKGYLDKKANLKYNLLAEYDSESKYVLIVSNGAYSDMSGNLNKEMIKTI